MCVEKKHDLNRSEISRANEKENVKGNYEEILQIV
jgi:hypothetical protein